MTWHTVVWDEASRSGAVEYTYEGHHRYHGAVMVHLDDDGRIDLWREWQHVDDERDFAAMLDGPPTDATPLRAIDHVQLGMPDRRRGPGPCLLRRRARPARGPEAASAVRSRWSLVLRSRRLGPPGCRGGLSRPPTKAHPAFVVDDLAAIRTRLTDAGVAIEDDDSGLPVARCYVRDPFGNRLELVDAWDAGFSTR